MKILHIDSGREWRGGQQQALYLHKGLIRSGIESVMVCPPGSPMFSRCQKAGLPVFTLPLWGEWDLYSAWRIARLVREYGFGVMQAHTAHAQSLAVLARMLGAGVPVITVRRVDFPLRRNPLSAWKYRTGLLTRIVCISEAIRDVMLSCGIPMHRLMVIHSAVDTERFQNLSGSADLRRQLGIPSDAPLVGTIAAMVDHKDYPNLVRAAALVVQKRPQSHFLALGDGVLMPEVRRQIERSGLAQRFHLAGIRQDVKPSLDAMDIFVLASKLEGMGTSLLDAASAGLPVVGTDAGGIPEVIDHPAGGLIVPRQDHRALAEAILSLLDSPETRQKMGSHNQQWVKRFSVGEQIKQYIRLYQTLVEQE